MSAQSTEREVRDDLLESDDVFDALAAGQRRQLLVDLLSSDSKHVSPLSDVSVELIEANEAFLEQYLSGRVEIPEADRELIQKYHVHLPKLAAYGFIEWNSEDDLVTKGPRFDEIRPVLELIESYRTHRPASGSFVSFSG